MFLSLKNDWGIWDKTLFYRDGLKFVNLIIGLRFLFKQQCSFSRSNRFTLWSLSDRQTDRQTILFNIWKNHIRGRRMTARFSSHPPPRNTVELLRRNTVELLRRNTVELLRRNTSRTAQETTNSLQISYRSTYIYKNGADISLRDKHT